jgi:hypothetical protein
VFTAPIFSANASWATYLLTKVGFFVYKSHVLTPVLQLQKFFSNYVISLPGSKGSWGWLNGSNYLSDGNALFLFVLRATQFGYVKINFPYMLTCFIFRFCTLMLIIASR